MEQDIKREALQQYLQYFKFWFITAAVMLAVFLGLFGYKNLIKGARRNAEAPAERVYDEADVLSEEEEKLLRTQIAKQEAKTGMDIVLVTIKEDVEAQGSWNSVMRDYADDFYDYGKYGYDKVHGDGVLLLDNWYEGQAGSWLSTCGKAYERLDSSEVDRILDVVYDRVEESPYEAYRAYVDESCRLVKRGNIVLPPWMIVVTPVVIAAVYLSMHREHKKASDTTTSVTFVKNGKPVVNDNRDEFIRKNVTSVKIETGSSGGQSGGGGGHRSNSGVSHGGGGRRR